MSSYKMALLVANKVNKNGNLYTLEALEDLKNQMIEKGYNAIIEEKYCIYYSPKKISKVVKLEQ